MIAYLADRPFREVSSLNIRTSRITKEFWHDYDDPAGADLKHQIPTREDGARWSQVTEPYPPKRRVELQRPGLRARRSFLLLHSAAVASILQDYGFATLIGEETSFNSSNCGGTHTFALPRTQIEVVYPKLCGVQASGDTGPHRVIPDSELIEDYFTEEEEVLQAALRIIGGSGGDRSSKGGRWPHRCIGAHPDTDTDTVSIRRRSSVSSQAVQAVGCRYSIYCGRISRNRRTAFSGL